MTPPFATPTVLDMLVAADWCADHGFAAEQCYRDMAVDAAPIAVYSEQNRVRSGGVSGSWSWSRSWSRGGSWSWSRSGSRSRSRNRLRSQSRSRLQSRSRSWSGSRSRSWSWSC